MKHYHGYIISGLIWIMGLYLSIIFKRPAFFWVCLLMASFFIGATRSLYNEENVHDLNKLKKDNNRYFIYGILSMIISLIFDDNLISLPFSYLIGIFCGLLILNKIHEKKLK
jgi:hypothetical protein